MHACALSPAFLGANKKGQGKMEPKGAGRSGSSASASARSSYSVVGTNVNLSLINQTGQPHAGNRAGASGGGVVISPLPPGSIISKILIKAVSKRSKKDPKTFTLRNINTLIVKSPDMLKKEIRKQLENSVIKENFDVGFFHTASTVPLKTLKTSWTFGVTLLKDGSTVCGVMA